MKKQPSGFTLVELAIVMTIIGLLITGVLRGQELVHNARVTSLIEQTDAYKAAVRTFQDIYSGVPGDLANASVRVANCNAANFCLSGDGSSIVGAVYTGAQTASDVSGAQENVQFWKHLALANLIAGVSGSGNPATPDWSVTFPSTRIGGGFQVMELNDTIDNSFGLYLRLQNQVVGALPATTSGVHPLSPIRARQIDVKIDDGISNSGDVTGEFQNSGCDDANGEYTNNSSDNCILLFKLDG